MSVQDSLVFRTSQPQYEQNKVDSNVPLQLANIKQIPLYVLCTYHVRFSYYMFICKPICLTGVEKFSNLNN